MERKRDLERWLNRERDDQSRTWQDTMHDRLANLDRDYPQIKFRMHVNQQRQRLGLSDPEGIGWCRGLGSECSIWRGGVEQQGVRALCLQCLILLPDSCLGQEEDCPPWSQPGRRHQELLCLCPTRNFSLLPRLPNGGWGGSGRNKHSFSLCSLNGALH